MGLQHTFHPQFSLTRPVPGYEIWFTVIIDSEMGKALWLRFSTFVSRQEGKEKQIGLIWASFFDAEDTAHHCFGVEPAGRSECQWINHRLEHPKGQFGPDRFSGEVLTNKGVLRWDLEFQSQFEPTHHVPAWLSASPLAKTKSIVCAPFAQVTGTFSLNETQFKLNRADGLVDHIWGTHRVEQLYWLFAPKFDHDDEDWGLEMVAVKPNRFLPWFTFVTLRQGGKLWHDQTVWQACRGKVQARYPQIDFQVRTNTHHLTVQSKLNESQITAYIYRDPAGSSRYIEHSDVGEVSCVIRDKDRGRTLICRNRAAVEFHGMKPWSQRQYLDPYP